MEEVHEIIFNNKHFKCSTEKVNEWYLQMWRRGGSEHTEPAWLPQHPAATGQSSWSVGPQCVFQQDSDPEHASRLCEDHLPQTDSGGDLVSTVTWPEPSWGLKWAGAQSEGKAANQSSVYMQTPSRLMENRSRWRRHEAAERTSTESEADQS